MSAPRVRRDQIRPVLPDMKIVRDLEFPCSIRSDTSDNRKPALIITAVVASHGCCMISNSTSEFTLCR